MSRLTRKQYVNMIAPIAVAVCKGSGLFPSLMVAQAIIESGDGNSDLARYYNNHFGIKANLAWKGKAVNMRTREVLSGKDVFIKDGFRAYDTLKEGFADRNNFLKVNPRYTTHGVFKAKNAAEQAEAFQRAGYATDPNYSKLLIAVNKSLVIPVFEPDFANVAIRLIAEDQSLASLDRGFSSSIITA